MRKKNRMMEKLFYSGTGEMSLAVVRVRFTIPTFGLCEFSNVLVDGRASPFTLRLERKSGTRTFRIENGNGLVLFFVGFRLHGVFFFQRTTERIGAIVVNR